MKDRVEAILFAAGRFVDEDKIAELLQEDKRKVRKALQELKAAYDSHPETALQVVQEEASWKMHVKDTYLDLVSKLVSDKEIAKTVLETLAIIAWKTPIMQAELIKIRGPAAYEHVTELIERGFITKEASGRSFKLKITDKFFEYFDVEGREDIRKLFKQVEDQAAAQQANIDQAKQDYESQKKAADQAQQALDTGETSSVPEAPKRENSGTTDSAHSAKNTSDLIAEVAQELGAPTAENNADLLRDMEADLAIIKKDADKLRPKKH